MSDLRERRKAEWQILHDRITDALDRFGKKNPVRKGDYWLLDDDWGTWRQELEIQNLDLFRPHVVKLLQALVVSFPDWEITMRLDVRGTENVWPAMGLVIHDDGIIDGLKRE